MKHPLRRKDRGLDIDETLAILKHGEYGIVSSVGADGQPYGVPVSYVIHENCIDFHSATEGHKLTNFQACDRVSFCVVGKTCILPEKFSTEHESVIVFGKISERTGMAKAKSLQALVAKYSPDFIESGDTYIAATLDRTRVFSISLDHISGKSRK